MSIQIIVDNEVVNSKLIEFSDGDINVQIDPEPLKKAERYVCLTIGTDTPVSQYRLIIQYVDFILDKYVSEGVSKSLNLPYFPHARADREFEEGMTCPLEHFMFTLAVSCFGQVMTVDVHNMDAINTYTQGFDLNITNTSQANTFVNQLRFDKELSRLVKSEPVLCAPDKGASRKVEELSFDLGLEYVQLNKKRNPVNGWIESVTLEQGVGVRGKDILIVDDICDGGMTFLKSAEALKDLGANSVSLYVTHGIFSKGLDIFKSVLDNVFCKQIVMQYISKDEINKFNGGK